MKIFVSSTYEDLKDHRRALEDSLAISRIAYNAMEHFGSSPQPPLDTCLKAVKASDVFVGVIGVRYGASPPKCCLSYTEREYRLAIAQRLPVFMFLIDERNAAVPAGFVALENQEQRRRLGVLRDRIRRKHTITLFTSPEDLSRLVLASLIGQFGMKP